MSKNYLSLTLLTMMCFFVSCGKLSFDDTVAYPLLTVSEARTPASEEIRSFVRRDDLIYTAAGSGGILVYRIVGDNMETVPALSLTNLFSEDLEQIFVRTVEILETELMTNLIFSFDTVQGGGVGVAEISENDTRPVGSLVVEDNFRIRNTVTSFNPEGKYQILVADENIGLLTYEMSFLSNDFFQYPRIAGLVDMISRMESTYLPSLFTILDPPALSRVTNISQITNFDALISLAINDESTFNKFITNIPFLSPQNQRQLQNLVRLTDKTALSNVLNLSKNYFSSNSSAPNLSDAMVSQFLSQQNGLSGVAGLLTGRSSSKTSAKPVKSFEQAQTIYEESYLSNMRILQGEEFKTDELHDLNYFAFTNRSLIGNAQAEIERTIQATGRRFFSDQTDRIKNSLYAFTPEELELFFQSALQQANLLTELIPVFDAAGVNLQEIFVLFQQKKYYQIIDILDDELLAQILRSLPKYQIKTEFKIVKTNVVMNNLRAMVADEYYAYLAAGQDGFYVIDRLSDKLVSSYKKAFSEISMIIPFDVYRKRYYVVVDNLDGLVVYRRNRNNKIGEQVARVALVGEAFSVFPYENVLWVADGVNGVLGIRMNRDETLTIESESYEKQDIAYFIGGGLRREVLASYGADGLKVLRLTNVLSSKESINQNRDPNNQKADGENFVDKTIEWSRFSPIAQFLKSLFFDI
ncbi:MAG: hypothetical protein ACRCS8_02950 [Brevinema sp.]